MDHACPCCGYEARCTRHGWAARHPAAAVTAGLFTLVFMSMMLSTHPIAALAVIVLAGTGGAAYRVERERERRAALAARAEHEYRALLAAPVQPVSALPQRQAHSLPWQMVGSLRTEPLRTAKN
jgi:heme/copper-type cytochrome/quinol oxidase subunit 2